MVARTAVDRSGLEEVGARPPRPAGRGGRGGGSLAFASAHPLSFWWGASLAVAILTALVWPTVPSYDPFSWIVWGREVTDPHIAFFVGSGPSWKPLPFFFTTIYGALGGVAPTLWVITARAGGIAGLVGAWRLSALLCRRAGFPEAAGALAGIVAAGGIVLTASSSLWTYYFFRGASEPLLIGVWVWAIDRLIERRHWQAFMLVAAEGLMRPEAWPFLLVYGLWLVWRTPSMRVWVLVGWVAQPVGWFVPPWISTGQPFLAATHASEYNGELGSDPLKTVLERGVGLQPLPSLLLAVAGVLLALWIGRAALPRVVLPRAAFARTALPRTRSALAQWWTKDRSEVPLVAALAGATIAWWVIVVVMTEDHYPGLERFFLPAAAMICVLSGYGLVRLAAVLGALSAWLLERGGGVRAAGSAAPARVGVPVALIAAAVLLLGSTHFLSARWAYARQQEPLAAAAVVRIDELGRAIGILGGEARILPCASSVVTVNHSLQTALAWKLGTTLARVETVLHQPGIAFLGPHDSIDGGEPPVFLGPHGSFVNFQTRTLGTVGAWTIQQVWPVGESRPACVGS